MLVPTRSDCELWTSGQPISLLTGADVYINAEVAWSLQYKMKQLVDLQL
jgi:hypothetical protein